MVEFAVNASRLDPYKNFKFQVRWDGQVVAGVSYVSALTRKTGVIVHRDGGDPSMARKSPGLTRYEPVTLKRGVTHDDAFENWANKVSNMFGSSDGEMSLADFRKDITIDLLNEAGQVAKSYNVYRCWPSEYTALPGLDANEPGVAFETLVLRHEGWARDPEVVEPTEPVISK
jgi:phage tail-like protein